MFSKRSPLNFPIVPYDRYFQDFEELSLLGEGGCGKVFKVRNRVDNNIYCIKMVKLSKKNKQANKFIKREVDIQSRLQNQHIVRYYNAWVEFVSDAEKIKELEFESSEEEEEQEFSGLAPSSSKKESKSRSRFYSADTNLKSSDLYLSSIGKEELKSQSKTKKKFSS